MPVTIQNDPMAPVVHMLRKLLAGEQFPPADSVEAAQYARAINVAAMAGSLRNPATSVRFGQACLAVLTERVAGDLRKQQAPADPTAIDAKDAQ